MTRLDNSMVGAAKYERVENDFYPTEPACTEALYKFLREHWLIHRNSLVIEPACGDGAISRVFEGHGHRVLSTDLYPQLDGAKVKNFLTEEFIIDEAGTIVVTNPPYAQPYIDQFIERINDMVHNDGVVGALLMRNEVDCAKSRRVFFEENRYYFGKLVLNWRPRWIPDSTGSPRHNYAWYIWSTNNRDRSPIIHYAEKIK